MKDLSPVCFLPVSLKENGHLFFGEGLREVEPDTRTLKDARTVLEEPGGQGPDELYYMYREVCREEDREAIRARGLRYDMTILKPGKVGREYIKTVGHYHPLKPGTTLTYPEVYEVIHGKAHYLFQKYGEGGAEEVILVEAHPGDKVLIPPNYGHITINPGDDFLVMSNWVASGFSSIYEPLELLSGGAYIEIEEKDGSSQFIPNPNYKDLPPLKREAIREIRQLDLVKEIPMYQVFLKDPENLIFLTDPEKYPELENLYR